MKINLNINYGCNMNRFKRFVNSPKEIDGIEVVQDINEAVKATNEGRTVCRYEYGDSMTPILRHGEYAKLIPISENTEIKRGDAVLCKLDNEYDFSAPFYMTHMVWEISNSSYNGKPWYKIGSSSTSIYGWTQDIYALAVGMNVFEDDRQKSE